MGVASLWTTSREQLSGQSFGGVADLIQEIAVALITTVDETGIVHTRQLPNVNTGLDEDLWFFAMIGSPLLSDLCGQPEVLITFADRRSGRFVVVNGLARIRNDRARARQLWHPVLASWLPGGPDDPALALIQVQIQDLDLWDYRPGPPIALAVDRE